MSIGAMNWMQVEAYVKGDDRAVLPLGSTEQHAYLSLMTDAILAERVATEAAQPLSIPVFPVQPYGMTPYFGAYPGTVSLRPATYFALVIDILDSLYRAGLRRILVVNGHGGNSPVQAVIHEWLCTHADVRVQFHNWWAAPQTLAKVHEIDPLASHASWMENFPWTRLADVVMPDVRKPMTNLEHLRQLAPKAVRELVGDGNYGGAYFKTDKEMQQIWQAAVAETRALLENGWAV